MCTGLPRRDTGEVKRTAGRNFLPRFPKRGYLNQKLPKPEERHERRDLPATNGGHSDGGQLSSLPRRQPMAYIACNLSPACRNKETLMPAKSKTKPKMKPAAKAKAKTSSKPAAKARAKVTPIPAGYRTITPHLTVKGAKEAIALYKNAFGAKDRGTMMGPDGKVMHSSLLIGDSIVMLNDEFPMS